MEPVRDHQLDLRVLRHVNHRAALARGHRHRLLAQHVQAGLGGGDRPFGVHAVGERDVDRVHHAAREQVLGVPVVRQVLDSVAASQLAQLAAVVRDQRGQLAVAPGVRERREDRDLRDVPLADDGIAHVRAPVADASILLHRCLRTARQAECPLCPRGRRARIGPSEGGGGGAPNANGNTVFRGANKVDSAGAVCKKRRRCFRVFKRCRPPRGARRVRTSRTPAMPAARRRSRRAPRGDQRDVKRNGCVTQAATGCPLLDPARNRKPRAAASAASLNIGSFTFSSTTAFTTRPLRPTRM